MDIKTLITFDPAWILFIGLSWLIWAGYKRILFNKDMLVREIDSPTLQSFGDMKVKGDLIEVKFVWSRKILSFNQVTQIKAYSRIDWGLEEHEQVDVKFDTSDKLIFDGSIQEHRDFVQTIALKIGIHDKTWPWGNLPYFGDKMGRDTVFEKTKSR